MIMTDAMKFDNEEKSRKKIVTALDGVWVDLTEANVISYNYIFNCAGKEIPDSDKIRALMGLNGVEIFEGLGLTNKEEISRLVKLYLKPFYMNNVANYALLFSESKDVLKKISEKHDLVILGGCLPNTLREIVQRQGINEYFSDFFSYNQLPNKMPSVESFMNLEEIIGKISYYIDGNHRNVEAAIKYGINTIQPLHSYKVWQENKDAIIVRNLRGINRFLV